MHSDIIAEQYRSAAPKWESVNGGRRAPPKSGPCYDPSAIRRNGEQRENRLLEGFSQSCPIWPNTIREAIRSIHSAEEDFAGAKFGLATLHICDRVGRFWVFE